VRPFSSAEAAVEMYLRMRERLESPRGASLTVSWGESFAAKCRRCGHPERRELHTRADGWSWRCARCGTPWSREAVELVKGSVQTSRRGAGGLERRLADLGTLGVLLGRLGRWQRECLLLHVGRGLSPAGIAEELARLHPRAATRPGNPIAAGRVLAQARRDLEAGLLRAGLLG